MASIDPHRLGLARTFEPALTVEIQSTTISDKHMLVEAPITLHESAHKFGPDAAALILWQHKEVRIVDDKIAIRDRITQTNKQIGIPR